MVSAPYGRSACSTGASGPRLSAASGLLKNICKICAAARVRNSECKRKGSWLQPREWPGAIFDRRASWLAAYTLLACLSPWRLRSACGPVMTSPARSGKLRAGLKNRSKRKAPTAVTASSGKVVAVACRRK